MTISEVAEKYELTADTLRYYERIGLLPRVNRNNSGIRDYTEEDCNFLLEQREDLKSRIADMQQTLTYLNNKIEHYDDTMARCEKSLKKFEDS